MNSFHSNSLFAQSNFRHRNQQKRSNWPNQSSNKQNKLNENEIKRVRGFPNHLATVQSTIPTKRTNPITSDWRREKVGWEADEKFMSVLTEGKTRWETEKPKDRKPKNRSDSKEHRGRGHYTDEGGGG